MSFNLSFLPRIGVRDKLQQESSIFGIFHRATFLDSRSPIGVEDKFRGNDENGGLFWTAFVKKGNLILELFQICPKVINFQDVIV